MRRNDRLKCFNHLGELSIMLVETKQSMLFIIVYMLLKFILLLPVAMDNVERVFSGMSLVKNKLRNGMGDEHLNHCLVTLTERWVFINVSDDAIVETFMAMRQRILKK
jgi:hypothetical protein